MCLACLIVQHMLQFDPPFGIESETQPPVPLPHTAWPLERLRAYYELLVTVQTRERERGVICEPTRAGYLTQFGARLAMLESQVTGSAV